MNLLNRYNLLILICQCIGNSNFNSVPTIITSHGTIGNMIAFFGVYVLLGIPLLYMELIIGQFTGRDCVDVWKIRPCLSYTGYILILWQIVILTYNHAYVSFTVHYFLISFENPIPYYKCGPWSTNSCNLLDYNYTVNEECIRQKPPARQCENIHTTFPEYQYWRYYLLGLKPYKSYKLNVYVAWRVCLASGLVCIFAYLSCFKRKESLKWVITTLPVYAILGFVPIMTGSMLQKGLVDHFEESLDVDFQIFAKKFRFANVIQQVLYNLGIGSGISFNFASGACFRFNCFSNSVIAVVISACYSILVTFTVVMMTCPYTYHYNIAPKMILKTQMSLVFEKVPRLLSDFDMKLLWIILVYSCYTAAGLCTQVLLLHNLLDTLFLRNQKMSNYPGLTCFVAVILLFLLTIPLLSNIGIIFAIGFRRYVTLASTFIAIVECVVFVICYGIHKFSEDVHFMLGIQPSFYMKISWLSSVGFLMYTFCSELHYYYYTTFNKSIFKIEIAGGYMLLFICGSIVMCCIGQMCVAIYRKNFLKMVYQDPNWGPKSEILQRSRGMFSARAMTKEYMYRQYHLQAGIISRQKNSNRRNGSQLEEQQY